MQTYFLITSLFLCSSLLNTAWLPHMIIRCFCYEVGMITVVFAKDKYDENVPILGILSATFGLMAVEAVFYVQHRNKAKLFLNLIIAGL